MTSSLPQDSTLGAIIQWHRKASGLSRQQLAGLAGVGKTVIFDIEHGKESIRWNTLQKILRILNITVILKSPLAKAVPASSKGADT